MKIFNLLPPIVYTAAFVFIALFFWFSKDISSLTREDGLIEWMSAICYICSTIFALYFYRKSLYPSLTIFWIIFSIICFGEETSWLQRQLNYSVKSIEKHNLQEEFNFHNLKYFGKGRTLDQEGNLTFNTELIFSTQVLFQLGLLVYFMLLPAIRSKSVFIQHHFPKIPNYFLFVFWTLVIISFALSYVTSLPVRNGIAETRECLYAFFILIHLPFLLSNNIPLIGK
ncbi:MAG: hypothetical protein WAT79_12945 [Saprospiraceae bacterium]